MGRRTLVGPGAFVAGFFGIVLAGKGIDGYLLTGFGMNAVVPNGIFLQGLVLGALNGLLAMGLVLVYRTNRIINFAQGGLGAFAADRWPQLSPCGTTCRSSCRWPSGSLSPSSPSVLSSSRHPAVLEGAAADPHGGDDRRRPDPRLPRIDPGVAQREATRCAPASARRGR